MTTNELMDAQIKAMGEETARWQALSAKQLKEYGELTARVSVLEEDNDRLRADLAKSEERAAHFEQEYIKAQSSVVIKTKLLEQANQALMVEVDETDRLQDALVQAAREIERLRGHIRELTEQRNALQDMAKAAVKFGDLGGER